MDFKTLTLDSACGGAIPELFEAELRKVLANIHDLDTAAETARAIMIKLTFSPKEDRNGMRREGEISVQVSSKIAPIVPVTGFAFFTKDGVLTNPAEQEEMELAPDVHPINEAKKAEGAT